MCLLDEVSLTFCWCEVWKNSNLLSSSNESHASIMHLNSLTRSILTCLPQVWLVKQIFVTWLKVSFTRKYKKMLRDPIQSKKVTWRLQLTRLFSVFFLEYAKDLRIIVIKKKNVTIQTTRFTSALGGHTACGWTVLASNFKLYYIIGGLQPS